MKTEKYTESQEIELAKVAQLIEDDIDNIDQVEREAQHLSEVMKADAAMTKRRLMSFRYLEKQERKKAQRSRQRLLFVILVYLCNVEPLRAMALTAMADDGFREVDGVDVA